MTSTRFLLCCAFFMQLCGTSYAYEQQTHRKLSETAVQQSVLAASTNNILVDVGLGADISESSQQKYPNSKGEARSIIELVQEGADFEDNGIRSIQHFYDPVNDRSLQHPLLNIAGGTHKSPDWALEDAGVIPAQEYSYADALDAYYMALTLPTKGERDQEWGRLFETLGHVIHHVQDMAQPEHVRNDIHCGEIIPCGIPGAVLGLYDQSFFERRSQKVFEDGVPGELINYPAVTFPTVREFWTTRATDGSVTARHGLADFTNRNFVSKDTNFELISGTVSPNRKYSLPAPIVDPTNRYTLSQLLPDEGAGICQALNQAGPIDLPPNSPCEIEFIKSDVTDGYAPVQGGTNLRAASFSLFDQYLTKYNVDSVRVGDGDAVHLVDVDRLVTINRFNIDAAHAFLIPRAVAYSAGLVDHFFRGRIDMVPNPNGEGWVINNLTDEDMQGDFTLYYDHIQNVNGQDVTQRDPIPGASWPAMVVPANGEVIVGSYAIPTGLLSKTLVFSGIIGAEIAVAGRHFGGWTGPYPVGVSSNYAKIVVDTDGSSMVVYYVYNSSAQTYQLWSRRYTSTTGWVGATLIANAPYYDDSFSFAMDANGNAMVAYATSVDIPFQLSVSQYTPVDEWSSATLIDGSSMTRYVPSVAMSAMGNAMVSYISEDPANNTMMLFSRSYIPAGGWSDAVLIESVPHDNVGAFGGAQHLAMNAEGDAMLVYQLCNPCISSQQWSLRHYSLASGWGVASPVVTSNYDPSFFVMDAGGNAMMSFWTWDVSTSTYQLWSRRYTLSGGWSGDALIDNATYYNGPIAMDSVGNCVIGYKDADGAVAVKHYGPSVGWGAKIELAIPNQQNTSLSVLSLDMSDDGKAVVLWRDQNGNLWSNHYTP